MLLSAVQQSESAIYIHRSPLFWIYFPFRSSSYLFYTYVCLVAQLCPTFWDPMESSLPGSSVHGISRKEYWSGLPFLTPGHLQAPGIKPGSLVSPALADKLFTISAAYILYISSVQFSRVPLFTTPWIAARQASLSITNSQNSLKLTSIESVMPSSHLIHCRPFSSCP